MSENQLLSKPLFHLIFILAALVALIAITETILVGVFEYSGLDGKTPITAACTNAYWLVKFLDIQKIL